MEYRLIHRTDKKASPGKNGPLGAVLIEGGVNFAVYSQYATAVFLLLFDSPDSEPSDIIKMEKSVGHVWSVLVKSLKAGQLYGYKADGEYDPKQGKRFNPHKLLIDPYSKALAGEFKYQDNLLFAYDVFSADKDLVMDHRDNTKMVPKSVVIDDAFDWQGDRHPEISMEELVIYEVHLKAFTAHGSSGVKFPGTYLGFIEKIPYLKELGINAVELMPIHQFFIRQDLLEKGLTNFWGYNTVSFFAPHLAYSAGGRPGCQVDEFKTLVRELHKAGIAVILDVVYNHTAEGSELGPTLSMKGLDNPTYYALSGNPEAPYRNYLNDTGCGNTINAENPVTMQLIMDSLRYWRKEMHVDGFRFDLASILARVKGKFDKDSEFFEEISGDPVLKDAKMIAEPWDLTTYEVGNFPAGWSEWNGRYRDTVRRFLKGDEAQIKEMATRLTGSADLYENSGKHPHSSINFITCHDGFTLRDLFSYDTKHNEANLEDNKDGLNENHSWNCGVEGETDDSGIIGLRKRMIKNAILALFISSGVPTALYGDEVMRTKKGNNNTYCQDNELTWFNWEYIKQNSDILEFFKRAVAFRKRHPALERRRFFTGQDTNKDGVPDIAWFGKNLNPPSWDRPKARILCYQIDASEHHAEPQDYHLFFILNAFHLGAYVRLPQHEGMGWYRIADTGLKSGNDILPEGREKLLKRQDRYHIGPRGTGILINKKL